MKSILMISCLISLTLSAQVSFTRLPNQPPANMYSVVSDPTNGDIYACSASNVIRSTDQGASWTQLANSGMNLLAVLYFSPSGQLYLGANHSNATPYYGITQYNKANNTWSPMTGSPQNISALLDDGAGNLYAGTGSTSNTAPSPINLGAGVYLYNGTSWSTVNTGMANLTGYSVLPFIKDMKFISGGDIVAATYGNGVIKYHTGSWSQYGTGLSNQYVNCLYLNAAGKLFAGTDANVNLLTGTSWSTVSTGLTANKPVRALVADLSGTIYAGLGFYVYQKGSIGGEIFYSTNSGGQWQNAAAGFNSTSVVSMVTHSSGTVFAAANGIWKTASVNNWVYAMSSVGLANNTHQLVINQQGDWFAICRNSFTAVPGCAGVFRSSDKGVTWTSINNGINCQKTDGILVDDQGWLWLTAKELTAATLNPAYGNPELYHSSDNGNTWIKDNTIENTSDGYNEIGTDGLGRVFVTESFNGAQTNICSSTNHAAFVNTLNPPPNNGGKSFGLAFNSLHHIFLGTETTSGLYRSTANGAPGTFVSLATPGVGYAPNGNVTVAVDPYTDYIFCSGTHGLFNGNVLPKAILGSTNIDNGSNMFIFNNLPDYSSLSDITFDNRGNGYLIVNSSNISSIGLYMGSVPWNANTNFTRVMSGPTLSYYFNTFTIDDCGYLYGIAVNGGGISKSDLPVNTPAQPVLVSPANNATGISPTPVLSWTHQCTPDSFRLQIATDSLFTVIVKDQSAITATSYTVPALVLSANTKYYWRVYGVNAVGAGKWTTVKNFTTTTVTPLSFLNFNGSYDHAIDITKLEWTTVNEINAAYCNIERSVDAVTYNTIGRINASLTGASQHSYLFDDIHPVTGKNFYRIQQVDKDGQFSYSKTILINTKNTMDELQAFPNPVKDICSIQLPYSENGFSLVLYNAAGKELIKTFTSITQQHIDIDLRTFPEGLYCIGLREIKTGKMKWKKIIKM
ncbi:MAG: T9SS type A sorting domain-containing protein [Ferruginibacter sp.]